MGQKVPMSWFDTLKRNTKRQEDDLIKNKLGKFRCDLNDYTNNRVFTWIIKSRHPILLIPTTLTIKNPNLKYLPTSPPLFPLTKPTISHTQSTKIQSKSAKSSYKKS